MKLYWGVTGLLGRAVKPESIGCAGFASCYYEAGPERLGIIPRHYAGQIEHGGLPTAYDPAASLKDFKTVVKENPPGPIAMADCESVPDWRALPYLGVHGAAIRASALARVGGDEDRAEREYTEARRAMFIHFPDMLKAVGVRWRGHWGAPWPHKPYEELEWCYLNCTAFFPVFYSGAAFATIKERCKEVVRRAGNTRRVFAVFQMSEFTDSEMLVTWCREADCDVLLWGAAWRGDEPVAQWMKIVAEASDRLRKTAVNRAGGNNKKK